MTDVITEHGEQAHPVCIPLWIGFGDMEEWLAAVNPTRPVLAMPLAEVSDGHSQPRAEELRVVCQQVARDGTVLYCRLRSGTVTRLYGEPFSPDWEGQQAAWQALWEELQTYLVERGLAVRRATVAWPKAHVFLDGVIPPLLITRVVARLRGQPATEERGPFLP